MKLLPNASQRSKNRLRERPELDFLGNVSEEITGFIGQPMGLFVDLADPDYRIWIPLSDIDRI